MCPRLTMSESTMASIKRPTDELPMPGLSRLKGLTFPWMVTPECLDAMKDYDVWEDDVWVTSHPKSGTHWLLETVNLILMDGHEDQINRAQQASPAEFDYSIPGMTASTGRTTRPLPQYKEMQDWKPPRVIMTHLTEELMPTQIYQGKGKVIFIIRNPKDVAVSLWHFAIPWKFDAKYEDWDYFFQQYLAGENLYGSWFDHTLDFWNKHRHDKNFLFLKYEEMKEDLKGAVTQIADFLGKPLSEEAINRVVELSAFQSMKTRFDLIRISPESKDAPPSSSQEALGSEPSIDRFPTGAARIIRKGIIGDWKSKLTVAQNEALDALYQEKMAGSGLKIQFE